VFEVKQEEDDGLCAFSHTDTRENLRKNVQEAFIDKRDLPHILELLTMADIGYLKPIK